MVTNIKNFLGFSLVVDAEEIGQDRVFLCWCCKMPIAIGKVLIQVETLENGDDAPLFLKRDTLQKCECCGECTNVPELFDSEDHALSMVKTIEREDGVGVFVPTILAEKLPPSNIRN